MTKGAGLRAPDYLGHILTPIERVALYTDRIGEAEFVNTLQVQDAVLRNIEVIGEAARNVQRVAPDLVRAHSDIPWAAMVAMRNRLTHGYMTVDLPLVWKTEREDLPVLAPRIAALLGR